jgi:glyoxylase-like metal-dependent hydrolase (beta-lactamase superfamily II)
MSDAMSRDEPLYSVGDALVARVLECEIPFVPPSRLFADWNAQAIAGREDQIAPGDPAGLSGGLLTSVHTWVVRLAGRTMLIDTGIGNGKTRKQPYFDHLDTSYLARLAAAGVEPRDVDAVLLTHLHTDHVGWNTRRHNGRWVPLFTNATYFVPQVGVDWFMSDQGRAAPNHDMFADSVLPVLEAGQAQLVPAEGGEVLPGLTYMPTPGHSIDHMSILMASRGELGVFGGDVMHNPVQVYAPEWNSAFCLDAERARASRARILDLCASQDALYFSTHFAETSAGRIQRSPGGLEWRFE